MFRRFGRLHARVLLYKQDELVEIENRLAQLDGDENTEFFLCTRRQDRNSERQALVLEAERKLEEYSKNISCR